MSKWSHCTALMTPGMGMEHASLLRLNPFGGRGSFSSASDIQATFEDQVRQGFKDFAQKNPDEVKQLMPTAEGWNEKLVDHLVEGIDSAFERQMQKIGDWCLDRLAELGDILVEFALEAGQVVCVIYVIGQVFKVMITTKTDEMFICRIINGIGGYFFFKSMYFIFIESQGL